ncbi:glutathione S-transferase-like protein [Auriculariales sp. MPI-PUGE-AT-0066]|nr:glutathione S-transferase-like protein [Auriculariales sp. MPI-PUGE-AT-0066]
MTNSSSPSLSRSIRILWLLEEIGVQYEVKKYKRTAKFLAPPELKQVHCRARAPVLQDGSHIIIESSAIVEYLISKYGSLASSVSQKVIWSMVPSRTPFLIRPVISLELINTIEEQLSQNEKQGKGEFLCGDHLTGSDFIVVYTFIETASFLPPLGPKTRAYAELIKARPAFQSVSATAGGAFPKVA